MLVGYARTSTVDQTAGLEAQERDLKAAGVQKVFSEQVSSVASSRRELKAVLEFLREGDTLVVTKLDRLARSVKHLCDIVEDLKGRGVALKVLDMGLDTSTASGELVLHVFGAIAEFERKIMLERQREGIAKAKAEGKYEGRKPTARAKADDVIRLVREGVSKREVASRLGIGEASVYRILKDTAA